MSLVNVSVNRATQALALVVSGLLRCECTLCGAAMGCGMPRSCSCRWLHKHQLPCSMFDTLHKPQWSRYAVQVSVTNPVFPKGIHPADLQGLEPVELFGDILEGPQLSCSCLVQCSQQAALMQLCGNLSGQLACLWICISHLCENVFVCEAGVQLEVGLEDHLEHGLLCWDDDEAAGILWCWSVEQQTREAERGQREGPGEA